MRNFGKRSLQKSFLWKENFLAKKMQKMNLLYWGNPYLKLYNEDEVQSMENTLDNGLRYQVDG